MKEKIPFHRPMFPYKGNDKLSNGQQVINLEKRIMEMYDVDYAIACTSGTMGLLLTIKAYYNNSDYKWMLNSPAFTWWSIKYIAEILDEPIKYHDIDRYTWLMKKPAFNMFSIPVHTFGNIIELKGLTIYDGAHALGSKIRDIGIATVFSLAPTKLITSYEGGIIITNEEELAGEILILRDKISRMPEVCAAMGLKTLDHIEEIKEWKKMVYNYYKKHIPGIFQEIPRDSNYNTIGFLNLSNLEIPQHIEAKEYYRPLIRSWETKTDLQNSEFVFHHIVCLPSWYNCPYEQIVDDIREVNNL